MGGPSLSSGSIRRGTASRISPPSTISPSPGGRGSGGGLGGGDTSPPGDVGDGNGGNGGGTGPGIIEADVKGRAKGKSIDADIIRGDDRGDSPPIQPGPGDRGGSKGLEPVPGSGGDGPSDWPYEPPSGGYGDRYGDTYDNNYFGGAGYDWWGRYGNWGWWYGPIGYTYSPGYWGYSWYSPWCFPYSGLTTGFWYGYHGWYGRSYFSWWGLRSSFCYSGWYSPYSAFYLSGYSCYYAPTAYYSPLASCRGGYYEFHSLYGSYVDYRCCSSDVTIYIAGDTAPASVVIDESAPVVEEVVLAEEPVEEPAAETMTTENLLRLGDYHFRKGEYDRSVELYTQALESLPGDPTVRLALGDALFALSDYHYASYMIRQALDLDAGWVARPVDKREFYEDPTDFERQLRRLERYVESHPFDEAALFLLGYNYYSTGQPTIAKDFFLRVKIVNGDAEYVDPFIEAADRKDD